MIGSACGRMGFDEVSTTDAALSGDRSPMACASCGDADGNGRFEVADVTLVAEHLAGSGSVPCPAAVDSNLDGAVTLRDLNALVMRLDGRVRETCAPCTLRCGDLDGSDLVDGDDRAALDDILAAPDVLDGCVAWAADANGDGTLDGNDRPALDELIATGVARCAP